MLLIIVPVIVLTLFFAWKYRESAKAEDYDPEWHHSTRLEMVIWSAPVAIILMLGTVTWISTHRLDPYRPLERIDENRQVTADIKPITVEVVAMDWKWLFFYPELGIGSVNEFAAPVDVPINFKITGTTAMNSFFVPALAGQIYAMGGMQTKLHAVINKEGVYDGFSANFSGPGFSTCASSSTVSASKASMSGLPRRKKAARASAVRNIWSLQNPRSASRCNISPRSIRSFTAPSSTAVSNPTSSACAT